MFAQRSPGETNARGVGAMDKGSGVYRGRDDVLQRMFGQLGDYWHDFGANPDTYIDGGEYVVVLGHVRARAPETGEPAEAPTAHVWRFEDGKVVWWRCYQDTALLHMAKGVALWLLSASEFSRARATARRPVVR